MTGGIVFDAYALAFAATAGVLAWIALRVWHRGAKVHDWAKEWPEYRHPKETHVGRVR